MFAIKVSRPVTRLAPPSVTVVLAAALFVAAASVVTGAVASIWSARDVGYPDSAALLVIEGALRTGRLYPPIDAPPYLVTLYGPLTYVVLAVPYGAAQLMGASPVLAVRLALLGLVACCGALVFLLARRVADSRSVAWLSLLFALAFPFLSEWAVQIRGDSLGVALSLLSILVVLRWPDSGRALVVAALCSGMALLAKQTFVSAPIAVAVWMSWSGQTRRAALWSAAVAVVAATGYLLAYWREPLMMQHVLALRAPVFELRSGAVIALGAAGAPALPFIVAGAVTSWNAGSRPRLLLYYCATGWLVACATIPQVGGNINYFWEPLFASSVFAAIGAHALQTQVAREPVAARMTAGALCVTIVGAWFAVRHVPILQSVSDQFRSRSERRGLWSALVTVAADRRILSTSPDIAVLSVSPEMPDPFLNAVLERGQMWSATPIVERLEDAEYDMLIIRSGEGDADARRRNRRASRGIQLWNDDMWAAVHRAYGPACQIDGHEIWLPLRRPVAVSLQQLGCERWP